MLKYYFKNDSRDPYYNHALEYFFANHKLPIFMLWSNDDAILLGRHQNLFREVDVKYARDNNIKLVRRLSGGGAIYTDPLNAQFTFIESQDRGNDFKYFAELIIEQLAKFGIKAEFVGRNDIHVNGSKVSGNAQYMKNSMVVHHGTILYNVNMEKLSHALTPQKIKFEGKQVKSVQSRVTTLSDMVDLDSKGFFAAIQDGIINDLNLEEYKLDEKDKDEIESYVQKFKDEDFILGQGATKARYQVKHPFGIVEYVYDINNGKMENFAIEGDFFSNKDIEEFTQKFEGKKMDVGLFEEILNDICIDDYIVGMNKKDFIGDIFA
ncbi:MAG: lipoate--protein ligase [Finegoldia sp.]|nr:lipoate--protein ligase [Finegoldia sp.]